MSPFVEKPGFGPRKNRPGVWQQGTLFSGGGPKAQNKRPIPGVLNPADAQKWFGNREVHEGQHSTNARLEQFQHGFSRSKFGKTTGSMYGDGVYITPKEHVENDSWAGTYRNTFNVIAGPRNPLFEIHNDGGDYTHEYIHEGIADELRSGDHGLSAAKQARVEKNLGDGEYHRALQPLQYSGMDVQADHPDPDWDEEYDGPQQLGLPAKVFYNPNDVKIVHPDAPSVPGIVMRRQQRRLRKQG